MTSSAAAVYAVSAWLHRAGSATTTPEAIDALQNLATSFPLGEENPPEYLRNNALATRFLAEICEGLG